MGFFEEKKGVFRGILGLAALVWVVITLNTGLFIDENGVLAIYKGIFQGQRMFVDAWGPLQMGGLLTYPLFALYKFALEPLIYPLGIGLVLYLRIAYTIIRLAICIYLYSVLKRTKYENGAFYASLFAFLFVMSYRAISYKSICDFGVLLFIAYGIRFLVTSKPAYVVLMGIASCIAVIAYPSMIILPVCFGVILLILSYKGYEMIKPFWIYLATCVVIAALVILYLQLTSGLGNIIPQLQYLEDSDYDQSLTVRIGMMLAEYAVFALVAYLPVLFIKILGKYRYVDNYVLGVTLSLYWAVFMLAICALRSDSISDSRFAYGCLLPFFWLPVLIQPEKKADYTVIGQYSNNSLSGNILLQFIFATSAVAQFAWLLSTNQDISVPAHMAYYVVLAVILIACQDDNGMGFLVTALTIAALFFGCFWVAEGNGGFASIVSERWLVEDGAFKGIALTPDDYNANLSVMELLDTYVTEDDYLLVAFGSNSTGYLNSDAQQAAGSAYMRTHINTRILDYWNVNPENTANYVLIDESCSKYEKFVESEAGQYILSTYTVEVGRSGNFVLLTK